MISFLKKPKEPSAILGVAIYTVFIMFLVAVINASNTAWGVFLGEDMISLVDDPSKGRAVIRQLISEHPEDRRMLEKVYLKKTSLKGPWLTGNQLKLAIGQAAYAGVRSTAVVVNGKTVLVMKNRNEAQQLLEKLKEPYNQLGGSSYFKENVQLVDTLSKQDKIVSLAKALDIIKNGYQSIATYEVKDGDTLWDVASRVGLSVEKLLAINPGLNPESIKPGDSIKLAKTESLINVETVLTKVVSETINYQVEEKRDSSLLKGQQKIVNQGKNGRKEVTYRITLNNGIEIARKQIAETITVKPENKVIKTGTRTLLASRGGGRLAWPASGSITSKFGSRGGRHTGIDIAGRVGDPVVAAEAGTVIRAGWYSGYGKSIDISHGSGVVTRYGHLSSINVSTGQVVSQGELIGKVGNTGRSTGPHLHFEVILNGTPYNPLNYL